MTWLKGFCVFIVIFTSICLVAGLLKNSTANITRKNEQFIDSWLLLNKEEKDKCLAYINKYQGSKSHKLVKQLYEAAFLLNIRGNLKYAQEASLCTTKLLGHEHYKIEAYNFIN
jgi:hypothetical protein